MNGLCITDRGCREVLVERVHLAEMPAVHSRALRTTPPRAWRWRISRAPPLPAISVHGPQPVIR
jgi:hypothetical protein